MNDFQDEQNPYRAEAVAASATQVAPATMPGFIKGVLIVGLVFASLRLLTVPLSFIGWATLRNQGGDNPMVATVPFELITSTGIVLTAFATCILLLMRRKAGITASYVLALFVVGSLCVAAWQGTLTVQNFAAGSPEQYGAIGGIVVTVILRLVWLAVFFTAVFQCKKWLEAGNAR